MRATYIVLWLVWGLAFLAIEFSAILADHSEDTLSAFVWRWEGNSLTGTVMRFLVAAFCVWLAGHLIFRWWR